MALLSQMQHLYSRLRYYMHSEVSITSVLQILHHEVLTICWIIFRMVEMPSSLRLIRHSINVVCIGVYIIPTEC